jgi:O-antigen ligase
VVDPFFNDHTSYGAVIAMLIPALTGLFVNYRKISRGQKILILILIGIFITAFIFSYTRAAWLSLAGAAGLWVIIKLRIRWQYIVTGLVILAGLFFSLRSELTLKIEQNKQSSSGKFTEHIQSIGNIRSDVSNLERLNRWNCAIRMFKEKPVFGWGPGTYMFQYAPFQKPWEKTPISTNAGVVGNAHSEYLGPLSEQGIIGFLSMLSVIVLTIWTGLKVYFKTNNRNLRVLVLSILLGLFTYYIHGVMNNFLDTDKASALFWGFTAMLVAADVYHSGPLTIDHK